MRNQLRGLLSADDQRTSPRIRNTRQPSRMELQHGSAPPRDPCVLFNLTSIQPHVPPASPIQSFALGAGHPQTVPFYSRSWPMPTKLSHHVVQNPNGRCVWRDDGPTGGRCLWEMHGVWGWDLTKNEPVALRESYFVKDPREAGDKDKKVLGLVSDRFSVGLNGDPRSIGTSTSTSLFSTSGQRWFKASRGRIS